jgi:hypothetical protein
LESFFKSFVECLNKDKAKVKKLFLAFVIFNETSFQSYMKITTLGDPFAFAKLQVPLTQRETKYGLQVSVSGEGSWKDGN